MPSETNCFSPACLRQTSKLRGPILKPAAILTFTNLVHLHHASGCTVWQHFHIVARVVTSDGASWKQEPLLLTLCLYNHHHRAFTWQAFYEKMGIKAIVSVTLCLLGGKREHCSSTHPTNHCFYICLSRQFHIRSQISCKINLTKQVRAAFYWLLEFVFPVCAWFFVYLPDAVDLFFSCSSSVSSKDNWSWEDWKLGIVQEEVSSWKVKGFSTWHRKECC